MSLDDYKEVNLHGTINLAQVAAAKGVKRFVFLSSIKVNGEFTRAGQIFSGSDTPHPTDNYGISKLKTEEALLKLAGETGMEVSIIRPPLVYGAAVKGNFRQLLSCIYKGWPLPLASIAAKRSYINLNNLVSLIEICMTHPMAANRVFTVSDNEDISIADLVNRMAFQLGVKPRLLPFPSKLLEVAGVIFRKEPITQRLCKPLLVDVTDAKRLLGWLPNTSVDQGLGDAAKWYLEEQTEALRPSMMRVN